MIIDIILDRKHDGHYDKHSRKALRDYAKTFGYTLLEESFVTRDEIGVKYSLCRYIDDENYNPSLKSFVLSCKWL